MKIFCTGVTGYIGGSVAARLIATGHSVAGLVRSPANADAMRERGIEPVLGTLDDHDCLASAARSADLVVNAANADHRDAAVALLGALEGSGKTFVHTSGSSIVGTPAGGHRLDAVYEEDTPFTPSPGRKARVELNDFILSHKTKGLRPVIVCPSLIYGLGRGAGLHSIQVPWLISLARKRGGAAHIGPGENIWSNVHIDDLVDLYTLAIERAPPGAFYYAENGENSMRVVCEAINRMLGFQKPPVALSIEEAAAEWGRGAAENTMGSNSRVRAVRARKELGWSPQAPSLMAEIEHGCYTV